ncbi:homoserine dehydrogenase [Malassezia cuniculi]|uniref:Homoserine dehydrogenase n=1 Tax=Malassezia cuniculi TaxID=948313 RepID=A0AAF0EVZ2_9BASI|nr:homoserine dehydrogenase [Malassezia cuniculi]
MTGIDVAIIGVGLVGSAVINQLATAPSPRASLNVVSLQNSKKLLIAAPGEKLSLDGTDSWRKALAESDTAAPSLDELVKRLSEIVAVNKRHLVVVDNTSDEKVASFYPSFLKAGFSIATPNKKAFSGSLDLYNDILRAALQQRDTEARPPLIYQESTVGAGLPIIGTLDDLVITGDKVIRIEGVLSGTLSYIFNEFSPPGGSTRKFSEIVSVARENGYTEPHPGDDLSGSDVARKLTILSRLIPELTSLLPDGYASLDTESLTPAPLADVTDADEYVRRLPEFDEEFDSLRAKAQEKNCVLRYVGVIDVANQKIKAGLLEYPADHPFATSLGGSDNIISFTTQRYTPRPLLVQGSGAGADVTAMGVVADLMRVAARRE